MKVFKLIIVFSSLLLIIGCRAHNANNNDVHENKIDLLPDTCGFIGTLLDNNKKPIVGEVVWLGEVIWNDDKSEGHFVLDGGRSPSTVSDESGNFIFESINTNDYVVIIGNLELDPLIIPKESNPNEAKIFNCTDGTIINVDEIIIEAIDESSAITRTLTIKEHHIRCKQHVWY